MKILFRYVFREFCIPLAYCLAGFMSIYVLFELFGVFSRMVAAKPSAKDAVVYFAGYVAPYFEYIAPACVMLATLYTMWRFCRNSEITAMRASGVGFLSISAPILTAAAIMAGVVCWVNESFVPAHSQWAKNFRSARFRLDDMDRESGIVYHNVAASRTWNVGAAMNNAATALEGVSIAEERPGGGRKRSIKAARAEYLDGEWWLYSPEISHYGAGGDEIPSPEPMLDALEFRRFPEFDETPLDFTVQNKDTAYYSTAERIRFLSTHPNMSVKFRREMVFDFWAKIAAPFVCIVIALFAIPAGIATGRQSVFRGVVCALCMFFAFYAVSIGCLVLARMGFLPAPLAAFLPHSVFLAIGAWMLHRQG